MVHNISRQLKEPETNPGRDAFRRSLSRIVGGTVLLAVLTVGGAYIFGGFTGLSAGGAAALILGVTFSYALGVGLMAAVFYSSRFHDESAHEATRGQFKDRKNDPETRENQPSEAE